MLEKIVVVLVGLLTSIVGALSPESLFASHPSQDGGIGLSSAVTQETLATLRASDGSTFAKLNVLWVEVDGHRVTDDAWGTGQVKEIQFKVGVKNVDGMALAVGDKQIPVHPTDVLTVRTFEGDFSYRGMGTPAATIQLQGTVKTTLLNQGAPHSALRTQNGQLTPSPAAPAPDAKSIAYVVLDTGEKLQTVDLASGGARVFTQESASAQAGTVLARWVKIDGAIVHDYAAGSGAVGKIEFQPAEAGARPQLLSFQDSSARLDAKARVSVTDFVGDYVVSQMGGGLSKLKLDGFASNVQSGGDSPLPVQTGVDAPLSSFDFTPANPATTDTLSFHDHSADDGVIVFHRWDFGDGSTSVVPEPTHRYAKPGVYDVVLNVTDNDVNTGEMHQLITVRNADPVPDFDFAPKSVTTQTIVSFSDKSFDPDGSVIGWAWDFGDGGHSTQKAPTHRFSRPGPATVTLSVVDDLSGSNSISKVVVVSNTPPLSGFTFSPTQPLSGVVVQFVSTATDSDGSIANYAWDFGDGVTGTGSSPTHAFAKPGVFTVSHTVTDNSGATDTASTQITVQNRPPNADFTSAPVGQPASVPVTFTSTSNDVDGRIVLTSWDFGDGSGSSTGTTVTHTFPRATTYAVTMTVTDDSLAQSALTRSISIANAAPVANFSVIGLVPRSVMTQLVDVSRDPDGDPVVNQSWDFGDGSPTAFGRAVNHSWSALGSYTVTLNVQDSQGHTAQAARQVRVVNAVPSAFVTFAPINPIAGLPVYINTSVSDPDSTGPFTYNVEYTDGSAPDHTASASHVFGFTGPTTVTVGVLDSDGGRSADIVKHLTVGLADPVVDWSIDPNPPTQNSVANFTDLSRSANGPLTNWAWNFGDSTTNTTESPSHVWTTPGAYTVTLAVKDVKGQSTSLDRPLVVNARPVPLFDVPTGVQALNAHVRFSNHSFDPDGRIVSAIWDFGDGSTSSTELPDHADHVYTLPGPHTVSLLVKDNRGALGYLAQQVNIANKPPVSQFTVTGPTAAYQAGQTLTFRSTSFDPDGFPITNTNWTFGDGTTGEGATITHVYPRTGIYHASLAVSDGIVTGPSTQRVLKIGAAHDLKVIVQGVNPDGTNANLLSNEFNLSLFVSRTGQVDAYPTHDIPFLAETLDSTSITLPAGSWLGGDNLALRLDSASFHSFPLMGTARLTEASGVGEPLRFVFELPLALSVSVHADPGDRSFLQAFAPPIDPLQNATEDLPDHEPVYRDVHERFHGTGSVMFADGRSIQPPTGDPGPSITIEARYLPIRALAATRDGAVVGDSNNFVTGWCRAAVAQATDGAHYTWTFDGSTCLANMVDVYPIGRWEVRATASYNFALSAKSNVQEILVDPTGGLMWSLGAPP